MQTRPLGPLTVSLVGLGCNNFGHRIDADQTQRVVHAALDAGITLFDTADMYSTGDSEELLGRALRSRRDEAVIATKFGAPMDDSGDRQGASPAWIATAVEDSLRRLGVDHIDLYQLHMPDDDTPIEETLGALDELVTAGKVGAIGHSNFDGKQVDRAAEVSEEGGITAFVSAQNRWSLLERDVEDEVIPACERLGIRMLPYFPLESGVLTGKYQLGHDAPEGSRLEGATGDRAAKFMSDDKLRTAAELEAFAKDHGHSLLELAISWLAHQPVTASVIAGATKVEQIEANAAAAGWELSDDERAEVDRITGRA